MAVSTGNLIRRDYERKTQVGIKYVILLTKKGIWLQDFPLKTSSSKTSEFENTLVDYLNALGIVDFKLNIECILGVDSSEVKMYDFSSAKGILVTSVPGYHKGRNIEKYGHMVQSKGKLYSHYF